jgi:hypothetical protein
LAEVTGFQQERDVVVGRAAPRNAAVGFRVDDNGFHAESVDDGARGLAACDHDAAYSGVNGGLRQRAHGGLMRGFARVGRSWILGRRKYHHRCPRGGREATRMPVKQVAGAVILGVESQRSNRWRACATGRESS